MIYWIIAGWLTCSVAGYILTRIVNRGAWLHNPWTKSDRAMTLIVCIFFAPMYLATILLAYLVSCDGDARW